MKTEKEEIYREWMRRRQSVVVPEDFAEQVMSEIAKQKIMRHIDLPIMYRVLSSHTLRWVAVAGAMLLGLFRLSYITTALLIP